MSAASYTPTMCSTCGKALVVDLKTASETAGRHEETYAPIPYVVAIAECGTKGCVPYVVAREGRLDSASIS
jgi:hypothetical protein